MRKEIYREVYNEENVALGVNGISNILIISK